MVELGFVAAAALLVTIKPESGVWGMVLGGVPTIFRLSVLRNSIHPRILDLFVGVFIFTLVLGIWAAFDWDGALVKASRLVIAVLLFYAVIRQPANNRDLVLLGVGLLGVLLILSFLLRYDATSQPSDFALIDQLGQIWVAIRPQVQFTPLNPNVVAGMTIFILPILTVGLVEALQQAQRARSFVHLLTLALLAIGLILTSSRFAWFSLFIAPVVSWLAFSWRRTWQAGGNKTRGLLVGIAISAPLLILISVVIWSPVVAGFIRSIPGAPTVGERTALYKDTLDLIHDYAFTGSGLATFSGIYSRYIRVIPFYYLHYSHNLYLDLALEQGVLGLIAMIGLLGYTLIACLRALQREETKIITHRLAGWGSLIGFVAVMIHGFGDDPLYGMTGTPLLLLPSGLALFYCGALQPISERVETSQSEFRQATGLPNLGIYKPASLLTLSLLTFMLIFWRPLYSGFMANLGAVKMGRVELADWSGEGWNAIQNEKTMQSVMGNLERSLSALPTQWSANYRIGLLSFSSGDFEHALGYLKRAQASNPSHRGVNKQLGYAYLWTGEVERGVNTLRSIPEIQDELSYYTWWWGTQDRDDLAQFAEQAKAMLTDK